MVRKTGSVREENSLMSPTGESFNSVVRRINGKRAKRMSGTASRAPTKTEPTPNRTARNERRSARGDAPGATVPDGVADSPSHAHIEVSHDENLERHRVLSAARCLGCLS